VLVAGSYPPIPVPSSAATVDAVRRELDAGHQVRVLSPRPSAAHYSVPITGLVAGRRLGRVRALSGCDRLVFCVEPGIPFAPPQRRRPLSGISAVLASALLAKEMRRFDHTTLVVTGDADVPERAMSLLRQAADEVLEDRRGGDPPSGVTVRGPKEVSLRDRLRRLAGRATRRVLGARGAARLRGSWLPMILLMAVVFAADVACPSGMTSDSIRQVSVAVSMVHFHSIGLDYLFAHQQNVVDTVNVHGHVYPLFPWGGALFAVPWVVGYDILHKLGIGGGSIALVRSGHDWEIQVLSASAAVAVTAAVVYAIAMRVLTVGPLRRRKRWAFAVALVFSFCTPAWSTASRSLWEHGPSMLFVAVAVLMALRVKAGERGWIGLGLSLGCSYVMRPTDAIPIAIIGLWVVIWHPRRVLHVVAGGIPPLAVLLTVDYVAYRQLLTPYYTQGQSFALGPTFKTALAGNLVSPGRGLLIYVPLVLVSAAGLVTLFRARQLDPLWIAFAAIPVVHWLVISGFKHWWAGDSYGPRLFTDLMPIFTVLALPAVDRLAEWREERRNPDVRFPRDHVVLQRFASGFVAVAILWSFAVHAQGAVLRSSWCWNNEPTDVDKNPAKVWSWSDPQFARGIRTLIWGPHRSWELIRDGVDKIGCPTEPVRP
jgi:hypothetical protein